MTFRTSGEYMMFQNGLFDGVEFFQSVRGYSSVVEHSTADREVHGSTPCAPLENIFFGQNISV